MSLGTGPYPIVCDDRLPIHSRRESGGPVRDVDRRREYLEGGRAHRGTRASRRRHGTEPHGSKEDEKQRGDDGPEHCSLIRPVPYAQVTRTGATPYTF